MFIVTTIPGLSAEPQLQQLSPDSSKAWVVILLYPALHANVSAF